MDKLSREDLHPLLDKILKRIDGWRGKLLSYKGRLILIKACMSSIPIYLAAFGMTMKGIGKSTWQLVCMRQEFGGLGIPNLHDLNIFLLGSWVKRYMSREGKIWRSFVDSKYLRNAPTFSVGNLLGPSSSGKGSCGLPKQLKWDLDG